MNVKSLKRWCGTWLEILVAKRLMSLVNLGGWSKNRRVCFMSRMWILVFVGVLFALVQTIEYNDMVADEYVAQLHACEVGGLSVEDCLNKLNTQEK